jgi:hypothetical protein
MLLSKRWGNSQKSTRNTLGEAMRGLSGLLCVVLIALMPVRASAIDKDKLKRFATKYGCEAAVWMAAKWMEEFVAAVAAVGKQSGCEWVTDKFLGPSPEQKLKIQDEWEKREKLEKLTFGLGGSEGDECRTDLDCGTTLLNCKDLDDCHLLQCEFSKTDPKKGRCAPLHSISIPVISIPADLRRSLQCNDPADPLCVRSSSLAHQNEPMPSFSSSSIPRENGPMPSLADAPGLSDPPSVAPSSPERDEWLRKFGTPLQNGPDKP